MTSLIYVTTYENDDKDAIYNDQSGFDTNVFNESHRPLIMEYTPNYLVVESAAECIKKLMKGSSKLKFIVMLRDPVKRVESSWKFKRSFCKKCLNHIDQNIPSFQISVERGMDQGRCISTCYNDFVQMKENRSLPASSAFKDLCSISQCRLLHDDKTGSSGGRSHLAHVVKSMYAYQLIVWYDYFKPSQFYIFTLESYIQCPLCKIKEILQFLNLSVYGSKDVDHHNQHGYENEEALKRILQMKLNETPKIEKVEAEVTPEVLKNLSDFFKPHNRLLQKVVEQFAGSLHERINY